MQNLEKDKICTYYEFRMFRKIIITFYFINIGSKPNLDHYVFFRVNSDVEGVLVEEETVDNRYLTSYSLMLFHAY